MGKYNVMDYVTDKYKNVRADKYIGIFGNPIAHTLSPVIHDNLSRLLGLDEKYLPFHIESNLQAAVNDAYERGILGLNITVPHKQEVMNYLTCVDESTQAIGAVNTLVRCGNGYKGYNTDMPGLAKAISSEGINLENKKIIMLGAGGAARAVAYMCLKYGAKKVYIVNRTVSNAEKIAGEMETCFHANGIITPLSAEDYKEIPKDNYIFIQCTSVGLHEGDGLPVVTDESFYDMAEFGIDLIYNPAKTPFLKLLDKKGTRNVNGLKMLLYQGIMAYELWNNVSVPESIADRIYRSLSAAVYGAENNIILVGYMGSGKTTVGKYIANRYGYDFLDTDEYIVKKEGMSINEIFAQKGEEYFRKLETDSLRELDGIRHTVISTGGGLPVRTENAELLRALGTVYYLSADAETIYERIKDDDGRPLLQVKNPKKKIEEMLKEREGAYNDAADVVINTAGKDVEEIGNFVS
ncbi:MAG: shikimate dehydrogenase [Clostridium sp.]|nr:shikimate dehydrogenase [Clostridium sp.]MCM1400210.1 shikimate dehydrogenase [Clostridium sp.]MCM1460921.1 shikimate dehydrogenase [Bacteroides sp.]